MCHSVYLLACTCWLVSWCVLVGLCVMVCTCWLGRGHIIDILGGGHIIDMLGGGHIIEERGISLICSEGAYH